MHRRPIAALALSIVALTAALCLPGSAAAQGGGFQETFDDAALAGWEHPPAVTVADGALQVGPGGFALHYGDWADITLSVRVRFSGEGAAVVRYCFRDQSRYVLLLRGDAIALEREQGQVRTPLASAPAGIQPDTWALVKVVVSGGRHEVYVDDGLRLTATDPQPLPAGAILLATEGAANAVFDDLDVRGTPVGGAPAGEPEPTPAGGAPLGEAGPTPGDEPAAAPASARSVTTPTPAAGPQDLPGGLIAEFFASQASKLELTTFLVNLVLAAACAYVLGLVYIQWGASLSNRRRFAASFLLVTITTTFIIMVVRSSVALSLGLVGALSIVRFRAAVKEPEELAYLFLAVGIGIGLGDNQRLITLLALALAIAVIGLRRVLRRPEADVNLHLAVASRDPQKVELDQIVAALRPHVARMRLLRFDETRELLEAGFLVEFGRMESADEARKALRALSDSLEITFTDNKGIW